MIGRCNRCKRKQVKLTLHHRKGKNILEPDWTVAPAPKGNVKLIAHLCDDCHKEIHDDELMKFGGFELCPDCHKNKDTFFERLSARKTLEK